jgi:hypothetical protein
MSLPLFDKKRMATTIMERRNRDGSKGASAEINPESPGPSGGLQDMAVDFSRPSNANPLQKSQMPLNPCSAIASQVSRKRTMGMTRTRSNPCRIRKFASAVAIHRNNRAKGGYIKNVGLHPHAEGKVETDDNEVDMLHKAVGGAIVDRIIAARDKGPLDEGQNQDGVSVEDGDEKVQCH